MSAPSNNGRSEEIKEEKRMLEGLFAGHSREAREFLSKYSPFIHAVATKVRTRDPAWSFEDLVNEAFVHLFEKDCRRLKSFQFQAKLSTFIYTVAWRYLIEKVGSKDRLRDDLDSLEAQHSGLAPEWEWSQRDGKDPEAVLLAKLREASTHEMLQILLASLNPIQKKLWDCLCLDLSTEVVMIKLEYRDRNQYYKAKHSLISELGKEYAKRRRESDHE
jgi:RNA polymerase sigma factor (sigma-70 family)